MMKTESYGLGPHAFSGGLVVPDNRRAEASASQAGPNSPHQSQAIALRKVEAT